MLLLATLCLLCNCFPESGINNETIKSRHCTVEIPTEPHRNYPTPSNWDSLSTLQLQKRKQNSTFSKNIVSFYRTFVRLQPWFSGSKQQFYIESAFTSFISGFIVMLVQFCLLSFCYRALNQLRYCERLPRGWVSEVGEEVLDHNTTPSDGIIIRWI